MIPHRERQSKRSHYRCRPVSGSLAVGLCRDGWTTLPLVRKASSRAPEGRWATPASRSSPISPVTGPSPPSRKRSPKRAGPGRSHHNAGLGGKASRLADVTSGESRVVRGHCLGAFPRPRRPLVVAQAGQGVVINVSSRLGSLARNASGEFARRGFSYSYRIAKAAQNMLTLCLADEFPAQCVRVRRAPGRCRPPRLQRRGCPPAWRRRGFCDGWTLQSGCSARFVEPGVGECRGRGNPDVVGDG